MKDMNRITLDPAVMGGRPCVRGLRVTVGTVIGLLAAGRSRDEILKACPYLEGEDGVKAAATSSMSVLTGVEGVYDPTCGKYKPPQSYSSWGALVNDGMRKRNLRLWNPRAVWRPVERR